MRRDPLLDRPVRWLENSCGNALNDLRVQSDCSSIKVKMELYR